MTNEGGTYLIYVVEGTAELNAETFAITSPPGTTATLRFAKVKDAGQEAVLDAHASTYPVGVDMKYQVQGTLPKPHFVFTPS